MRYPRGRNHNLVSGVGVIFVFEIELSGALIANNLRACAIKILILLARVLPVFCR